MYYNCTYLWFLLIAYTSKTFGVSLQTLQPSFIEEESLKFFMKKSTDISKLRVIYDINVCAFLLQNQFLSAGFLRDFSDSEEFNRTVCHWQNEIEGSSQTDSILIFTRLKLKQSICCISKFIIGTSTIEDRNLYYALHHSS